MAPFKRVAVCVDDYGLHDGINTAALALAAQGRITGIGCQVAAPAWHRGIAALRALDAAALDVGLHLDLTEHPVDLGLRAGLPGWISATYVGRVDTRRLRAELHAQLNRFEAGLQRPPAYVDGHQHVHQLPQVRELLLEVLAWRYPDRRPWLRISAPPAERGRRFRRPGGALKAWLIGRLGAKVLRRLALGAGFTCNRSLLGVYGFDGTAHAYAERLARWLGQARDGDLLMCHPSAAHLADGDAILPARLNEYAVLAGSGFEALLMHTGTRLLPMSRIVD